MTDVRTQTAILPDPEVRALIAIAQDANRPEAERIEARNRVVMGFHRMCYQVAIQSLKLRPSYSFDKDDLVSYGVEGIIIAIEKFDPGRTNTFSSYVRYWILHEIGYARECQDGLIYRPHKHVRLDRPISRMLHEGAGEEEICRTLQIRSSEFFSILRSRYQVSHLSERFDVADRMPEEEAEEEGPGDYRHVLANLRPDDRRMVERRLQGWKLRQIGEEFGISYEAVRHRLIRIREELRRRARLETDP